MQPLLQKIKNCKVCEPQLELGANPILRAHANAKIVIIGQAPGIRVHKSGIPWNDPSGVQLRKWLNMDEQTFYNERKIAIIPMGFCYPGKGKSGDLPPRKECAPLWHTMLLDQMQIRLTLLIGSYAQKYYLPLAPKSNLTETVKNFSDYLPEYFPLPHPSPRNRFWLLKNHWFDAQVIPELQRQLKTILAD